MQKRLASVAATTTILAVALTGCSQASDAADKAKAKASEAAAAKASEAAGKLKDKATEIGGEKAGAVAEKLANDVLDKLSPEEQEKLQGVDSVALGEKGELVEDKDSLAVAEFFAARQSAAATGGEDLSALEALTTPRVFKRTTRYVVRNSGKDLPFVVNVVSSDAGTVDVCVGAKGKKARTITVKNGKVARNVPGSHTC